MNCSMSCIDARIWIHHKDVKLEPAAGIAEAKGDKTKAVNRE